MATNPDLSDILVAAGIGASAANELESRLSGAPRMAVRYTGTLDTPITTFNGASSSGLAGLPAPIALPAGSIINGVSKTEITFLVQKVGTGTPSIDIRFGPLNSVSDTSTLAGAGATTFAATDPVEVEYRVVFTYSNNLAHVRMYRTVPTGSFYAEFSKAATFVEFAVNTNVANFINLVFSGGTAGTSVKLIEFSVVHF